MNTATSVLVNPMSPSTAGSNARNAKSDKNTDVVPIATDQKIIFFKRLIPIN